MLIIKFGSFFSKLCFNYSFCDLNWSHVQSNRENIATKGELLWNEVRERKANGTEISSENAHQESTIEMFAINYFKMSEAFALHNWQGLQKCECLHIDIWWQKWVKSGNTEKLECWSAWKSTIEKSPQVPLAHSYQGRHKTTQVFVFFYAML